MTLYTVFYMILKWMWYVDWDLSNTVIARSFVFCRCCTSFSLLSMCILAGAEKIKNVFLSLIFVCVRVCVCVLLLSTVFAPYWTKLIYTMWNCMRLSIVNWNCCYRFGVWIYVYAWVWLCVYELIECIVTEKIIPCYAIPMDSILCWLIFYPTDLVLIRSQYVSYSFEIFNNLFISKDKFFFPDPSRFKLQTIYKFFWFCEKARISYSNKEELSRCWNRYMHMINEHVQKTRQTRFTLD